MRAALPSRLRTSMLYRDYLEDLSYKYRIFLWTTDQPTLNEQTQKKMLLTSSVLTSENLVVIDAAFNQETLRAGAVRFLNSEARQG